MPTLVRALPGVFLALALCAFCQSLILQGHVIALGDVPDQFLPWREFTAQRIAAGQIPLWNPFSFCGAPFLANMQSCVLYPPDRILDLLFPAGEAQSIGLVFHLWLGALFMYALAVGEGARRFAALIAAIGYSLGGFHAIHLLGGNLLTVTSSIYLPGHLLVIATLARRIKGRQPLGWVPALGAILGMLQVLSGHAQMTFYNALFALIFAGSWLFRMKTGKGKMVACLAGIAIVSLLLSAPQLLPTLEYSRFSSRTGPLPYGAATEFSLGWEVLPSLFLPEYLGTHADGFTPLRTDTFWGDWKNWSAVYVGILPALGFFYFLARGKRRMFLPIWGPLLLVALFLSLGRNNPLYSWVHALPLFGQFRAPSKFLPGLIVPLAVLGSVGISMLYERLREPRGEPPQARSGFMWVLLLTGLLGHALPFFEPSLRYASGPFHLVLRDTLRSASILLAAWAGVCISERVMKRPFLKWLPPLFLILLSLVDLGPFFKKYVITASPDYIHAFPSSLVRKHFEANQRLLATSEVPHLAFCIPSGIPTPGGYDPFQVGVYVEEFRKEGVISKDEIPDSWSPPVDWAARLGAGLVLSSQRLQEPFLLPLDREPPWFLYRVKDPSPFVELQPASAQTSSVSGESATPHVSALSVQWEGQHLHIEGSAPSEGNLLIREIYAPGWIGLTSSGAVLTVEKAEPFWQQVRVPKGDLNLTLVYDPPGWRWGKRVFPLGLAGLVGLVLVARKRHANPVLP
jgi:hypothetical protein